jgi:hypothetical protein
MQAHRMRVVVPVVVQLPASIRSGPVELIVLVPSEHNSEESGKPEGHGRMAALARELGKDPRPFRELNPDDRSARLDQVMGIGRGLMSGSEELARRKGDEIELEDR